MNCHLTELMLFLSDALSYDFVDCQDFFGAVQIFFCKVKLASFICHFILVPI